MKQCFSPNRSEAAEEQWYHKDPCQHGSLECKAKGLNPGGRQLKNYCQMIKQHSRSRLVVRFVKKIIFRIALFNEQALYVSTLEPLWASASYCRRRNGSIPLVCFHIACTIRLSVRTLPFQGGKTSSILVSCTKSRYHFR